jgi:hypothetical protein
MLFIQNIRNANGFFEKYKSLSLQKRPAVDHQVHRDKVSSHN